MEGNESAAKGAGFGSFDAISPYLRSLIALHHDTLGTPVIPPGGVAGMDVTDATVLRSIPLLDQAALDTVRQWRYEITTLNGMPVPVILTATVSSQ